MVYLKNSRKMTTRQKGGDGSRKKMTGTSIMPRRWDAFLPNSQNRASLFQFISNCVKSKLFLGLRQKKMETIYNENHYSADGTEPAKISPCNHKEDDCRTFL